MSDLYASQSVVAATRRWEWVALNSPFDEPHWLKVSREEWAPEGQRCRGECVNCALLALMFLSMFFFIQSFEFASDADMTVLYIFLISFCAHWHTHRQLMSEEETSACSSMYSTFWIRDVEILWTWNDGGVCTLISKMCFRLNDYLNNDTCLMFIKRLHKYLTQAWKLKKK